MIISIFSFDVRIGKRDRGNIPRNKSSLFCSSKLKIPTRNLQVITIISSKKSKMFYCNDYNDFKLCKKLTRSSFEIQFIFIKIHRTIFCFVI